MEAEKTITPVLPSNSRRAVGEAPLWSNGAGNCGSLILCRGKGGECVQCLTAQRQPPTSKTGTKRFPLLLLLESSGLSTGPATPRHSQEDAMKETGCRRKRSKQSRIPRWALLSVMTLTLDGVVLNENVKKMT